MQAGGGILSLQEVNLSQIVRLPASTKYLTLINCSCLHYLTDVLSSIPSLEHLAISSGSSSLAPIRHSTLTALSLSSCTALRILPETLPRILPQLQQLDLSGAEALQQLPEDLGDLAQLRTLDLTDCKSLTDIPESTGDLTALTALYLGNCSSLVHLPSYIGNLKSLEILDLSGCTSLSAVPTSLGRVRSLKTLDLSGCVRLAFVPEQVLELPGLDVRLDGCSRLHQLMGELLQPAEGLGIDGISVFEVDMTATSAAATAAAADIERRKAAAPTGPAQHLFTRLYDSEAADVQLDNSKKQRLSQLQRRCRRIYRLVHYQQKLLQPLKQVRWVLMLVVLLSTVLLADQLHSHGLTIWHELRDTSPGPESSSWDQLEGHGAAGPDTVQQWQLAGMAPVTWSEYVVLKLQVEEFPGVKRYELVRVINALPFAIKAFFAAVLVAVVTALLGLLWIAVSVRFATRQQQQQQQQQGPKMAPEAAAGRFWLLLLLSHTTTCIAVTACYCACIIFTTLGRLYSQHVLTVDGQWGAQLTAWLLIWVWLCMPGLSVLCLGALWVAEDMGRLYPGWAAVRSGVKPFRKHARA